MAVQAAPVSSAGAPDAAHAARRPSEVNQSGDETSGSWSLAILSNLKIKPEYSGSYQPFTQAWVGEFSDPLSDASSLWALEIARPPQAPGDAGLDIDSEGDAAPSKGDAREEAAPHQDARPCYDLWLHDAGLCRPCSSFFKKAGCASGDLCELCHFPHMDLKRARPSKVRRRRSRHRTAESTTDEERPTEGSYMRSILASRARRSRPLPVPRP